MDAWTAVEQASILHAEVEDQRSSDGPLPVDQPERSEVSDRTEAQDDDEPEIDDEEAIDYAEVIQGAVQTLHQLDWIREEANDQPLTVVTYGLIGEGRGRRDFTCSTTMEDLWSGVVRTWPDIQSHRLYFVEPQPLAARWPYIVFIVEEWTQHQNGQVPILLHFMIPNDMYNIMWDFNTRATYFRQNEAVINNIESSGIEEVCSPGGLRICHVAIGGEPVVLLQRPYYAAGSLCDVSVDPFPEDWRAAVRKIPNFEQFATTILMLRRGALVRNGLHCVVHATGSDEEAVEQHFQLSWSDTQHPSVLAMALLREGVSYDTIAFVWPQAQSEGEHRWRFVGGDELRGESTHGLAVFYSRASEAVHFQHYINNPERTIGEVLRGLRLPEWCSAVDLSRLTGLRCQRLSHGRRLDFSIEDDVRDEELITLMQVDSKMITSRSDDGEPRIEEVIEHYQTNDLDEDVSEDDAEMGEEDEETGDQDIEPEHPDDPEGGDEHDDQQSWSDSQVHGMIFRKGHPVAHVWVHHENYDVMVTEISQQLAIPVRSILGVHYIDPGPFDRPHIGFAALLRCEGDQYAETTECLTLVDVFVYSRAMEPQEPALHRSIVDLPPLLTRRQLLERIGLEPMCAARRHRCLVKVEGQTVPLQHTGPIFVQHASYIVVRVPPFEEEDFSCEGVSLMQQRSRRTRVQPVHLFRLRSLYNRVQVRFAEDDDNWMVDRLSALDIEIVTDLNAVYEVTSPPRELEATREPVFIVEGWGDRYQQTSRDDRLVLLDIDIRQSSRLSDLYPMRRVSWCHQRVTRTSLLTFLRIHELCFEETFHGCSLFLNHVEISDENVRSIQDGDYVRVMILGRDRPWDTLAMLRRFEESDRERRVFQDSSEEPTTQCRNHRQVNNQQIPDRWRDGSSSKDSQRTVNTEQDPNQKILKDVTNTWRDAIDGQEVVEPVQLGKPHVLDRWCVEPAAPVARPLPELQALQGSKVDQENPMAEEGSITVERRQISIANLEGLCLHEIPINIDEHFAAQFEALCSSQELSRSFPPDLQEMFPPVAREWVERYPYREGLAQDNTYIYTDGAAHGSFEQEQYKSAAYAAVIFAEDNHGQGRHLVGWKGGFVETDPNHPEYNGAQAKDAINAEQSAILQALLIVFSRRNLGRHTICFDNQAAGYGADGIWTTNQGSDLAKVIRLLTYMMHQMNIDVKFQHVKAHSNQPQNDIVDQCAKNVSLGKLASKGIQGSNGILSPENLHRFILWQGAGRVFPVVSDNKLLWVHHETTAEPNENIKLIPEQQVENVADKAVTHKIYLHLATYNVLTLRARHGRNEDADADATFMHKASYLAQQVTAHQINIIGIQESRSKQSGVVQHDNIYRLIAKGTEQGTHGCELWFNLAQPLATIDGKPYYVETDKVTVIYESPTILIAKLQLPGMQITVGTAHAPQSGSPSQYRADWWKHLEEVLQSRRTPDPIFIMGDFNATLPETNHQQIGKLTCSKANANSMHLAMLMEKVSMWAPSTFEDCHEGSSSTWTHASGQTSRIDYILVDEALAMQQCHSYPLPDLDAGNPIEDHQAVGLSVTWSWTTKCLPASKKRIDWHAISQRHNAEKVRECLANIPNCAWGVDIHDHMQFVQDSIQYQLRQNFETSKKPKMRPYITDRTWRIRSEKLQLRGILRQVHREASDSYRVAKAIGIWSERGLKVQQTAVWVLTELFAAKQLRQTSRQLKASLKEDRDTHIANLADDIGKAGSAAEIHQALSRLKGTSKQRKRGRQPLPQLIGEDGQAQTQEERSKIWQQRCAQLEVGHVTTVHEIRQRCRSTSYKATATAPEMAVDDIPTVLELEARIRKVRRGKAPGPDGLRSDLCAIAAPELSRLLYPILVKQTLHIEEPIQARGGLLVAAYKGKGRQCDIESFRSLLLSNHLGKCMRGVYRPKLQPFYANSSSKLHFAAKLGGNVSHASQLSADVPRSREKAKLVELKHLCRHFFCILPHYPTVCSEPRHPKRRAGSYLPGLQHTTWRAGAFAARAP